MADDLIDLRSKVSPRTHAVLHAVSIATGREMAELVREVMSAWAETKIHEATVVSRVLRSEGVVGDSEGGAGK